MIWAAIVVESWKEPQTLTKEDGSNPSHLEWAIKTLAEGIETWLKENE